MSITPILRWLSMKLFSSPHTSPISASLTLGKEPPNSSLLISRRNYACWIVWSHILNAALKLRMMFFSSKLLNPSLTCTKFELQILCGHRKLELQVLSVAKVILICSRILLITMVSLSTMAPSSGVLSSMKSMMVQTRFSSRSTT